MGRPMTIRADLILALAFCIIAMLIGLANRHEIIQLRKQVDHFSRVHTLSILELERMRGHLGAHETEIECFEALISLASRAGWRSAELAIAEGLFQQDCKQLQNKRLIIREDFYEIE